jgi:hypothetical protein
MISNRKRSITLATALIVGACLEQAAFAQSNCKQAKGDIVWLPMPGTSSAQISNGGDLNGTIVFVDTSGPFATPDPAIVSYATDLTITTSQGQLKATAVNFFDFSTLVGSTQARINPAASTGRFAGAKGFLFLSGFSSGNPLTAHLEITGQICYATQ